MSELITFCLGFSCGAGVMWWYFAHNRLIRTREEWYADPMIRERFPEDRNA